MPAGIQQLMARRAQTPELWTRYLICESAGAGEVGGDGEGRGAVMQHLLPHLW